MKTTRTRHTPEFKKETVALATDQVTVSVNIPTLTAIRRRSQACELLEAGAALLKQKQRSVFYLCVAPLTSILCGAAIFSASERTRSVCVHDCIVRSVLHILFCKIVEAHQRNYLCLDG